METDSNRLMMMKNKRKIIIGSVLVAIFLFSLLPISIADASWYDTDWLYRKKITIDADKVQGDETNFPVLISFTDDDLKDYAQNFGEDILFTNSGSTKLSHEIESFNGYTGALYAWVKVLSLSGSTDTELYMYFGNDECISQEDAENVWDSSYKMVQHMKDKTTSTIEDSTSNSNDGTKKGANEPIEDTTNAKIYACQDFDGTDDYIDCGTSADIDLKDTRTYSSWVKIDNFVDWSYVWGKFVDAKNVIGLIMWNDDTLHFRAETGDVVQFGGTGQMETSTLTEGTWYYIVCTLDETGQSAKIYQDGVEKDEDTSFTLVDTSAESLFLGSSRTDAFFGDCHLESVRVSNIVRSANWIKTEYNNQNNPSSFYSVGPLENVPTLYAILRTDKSRYSQSDESATFTVEVYDSDDQSTVSGCTITGIIEDEDDNELATLISGNWNETTPGIYQYTQDLTTLSINATNLTCDFKIDISKTGYTTLEDQEKAFILNPTGGPVGPEPESKTSFIEGYVRDINYQGMDGAAVRVESNIDGEWTEETVYSGSSGYYIFYDLRHGVWILTAYKEGYQGHIEEVTLDVDLEHDIMLLEEEEILPPESKIVKELPTVYAGLKSALPWIMGLCVIVIAVYVIKIKDALNWRGEKK